jgi:hypothetical protein
MKVQPFNTHYHQPSAATTSWSVPTTPPSQTTQQNTPNPAQNAQNMVNGASGIVNKSIGTAATAVGGNDPTGGLGDFGANQVLENVPGFSAGCVRSTIAYAVWKVSKMSSSRS